MKKFLNYYQDTLLSLRESGGAFAKAHPDVASRLDIKNGKSVDPHTERIIESVAFMAAKLNQKIDDNAHSMAFHLLSALYPNLVSIFPPCSVAQFSMDKGISVSSNIILKKGTNLFCKSRSGEDCLFRTIYPLNIYPISISEANLTKISRKIGGADGWCMKIGIRTNSIPIEEMRISDLLFHINSEIAEDALLIYESIFSGSQRSAFLQINETNIKVNNKNFVQCGFRDEDSVCPVPKYSNNSFQLFQEMLHFKRKFMFFKLLKLHELILESGITNITEMSLLIDINYSDSRLNQIVNNNSILINAVPIVNLFPVTSDPFRFDGTKSKYLLLADQTRDSSIEIHSITELHMIDSETKEDRIIPPYFALPTDSSSNNLYDTYWVCTKESSEIRNLDGFDFYVSLIDTKMNPYSVYANVIYAKLLCTNRTEITNVPVFANLYVDGVETAGYSAKLIQKPTDSISFAENTTFLWNLVSQLSSTHISISRAENLLLGIKGLINIFGAGFQVKVDELTRNIETLKVNEIVRRFGCDAWRGFVRGMEVTVYVNEEDTFFSHFFCTVLNQYLSTYVSLNSFIELKLVSQSSNKVITRWLPTSGRKELI
ncbi:MAG: type VI secretion system baseplate subunit TssF [Holosporales bacterium]|jgi:type VI secretion system protein ImpG|nr:type VI secretion system baseplate subunit TssF [Holosporales bacterium]